MVSIDMIKVDGIATKSRVCRLIAIVCLTHMVFMALTMALTYCFPIPEYVSADYLSLFPWYCQPIVVGIETLGALSNPMVITAAVWYFQRSWIGLLATMVCVLPGLVFAIVQWQLPMSRTHFVGMLGLEATTFYAAAMVTKPFGRWLAPLSGQSANQFYILEICLLTSSVAGICVFSKMDGVDSGFNLWNYTLRSMSAGGIVTAIFANQISLSAIVLMLVWILPAMIDFLRNDHLLRSGFFVPIIVSLFSLLILLIRWRLGHTFPVNNTNSRREKSTDEKHMHC